MATSIALQNVVISTIKPQRNTEHVPSLESSLFDFICLDAYTPVVFFYKPETFVHNRSSQLLDGLKRSLGALLVPYFPFAGRWVRTCNLQRELKCNDEGVPFIEAFVDENMESVVNISAFEEMELLRGFRLMGLDPTSFYQDVEFPLPSLFIQVTQFKCGGVALNANFSHMTTDGSGMFTFMKAWSDIALRCETSVIPSHDRSLINSHAAVSVRELFRSTDGKMTRRVGRESQDSLFQKVLHVKRQAVDDLKNEAAQNEIGAVTTVDLVSAHIWQSIHNLPVKMSEPNKKTIIRVATAVNARERGKNPIVPQHFSGNAFRHALFPPIPPKSHLLAARAVHESVEAIALSIERELFDPRGSVTLAHEMPVALTSWFRFPLYEINFGHGYGNPILAIPNAAYRSNGALGVVLILPPRPGFSRSAIATLMFIVPGFMDELFSNEQFLSFFV